ncbi:C-type mannose receptor 2 [Larimichthys crocea]|uniref:C-type mannose receptor 2 n=1 Tax=Larimichthys crocea TaxID=215358 RepID=UPI000900EF30|nr:C-type mannose receptor 2 [Larimichthys crocea]
MTQTLHLLFISGFCCFALGSLDFHLIKMEKTYQEAKTYCRTMYTDLATVHNSTDMDNLISLVSNTRRKAWIGLEIGAVWMWHWTWPDQKLDFSNWKEGNPKNNDRDACAAMDIDGKWFESDCKTPKKFVCGNNASVPTFVNKPKSWRDAQKHCRNVSSDLVSIHSVEENEAVRNSGSKEVWIGLFKDRWKWSDGSNSSFRYWKSRQPNYLKDQDCVAAIFEDEGRWNDLKCRIKRNFVCRGAKASISTSFTSTSTQDTHTTKSTTLPNNLSPVITLTIHLTVAASTNHSNITTTEATTASQLTTLNTTDHVSSTSSTDELNNTTAEMSAVTGTQLPPTTTVQGTADGVSALTTLMGTSTQTTAQPTTLKPTDSPGLLPANLILIQENMTWTEAMSYCREHHIDLVYINTKDIQDMVAEKAKNAKSPYVWLGLRYTCKFNFWFWSSSTIGCYQNWAPGEGAEGKYNCGVTGAIKTTGRQQWVGLPETEKLNFICYGCAG